MGVLIMKRFKTGILFNIISLTLCLSAIVINVYSATVSQVNISGSLGYVKHESSFTVSFVKGTSSDFTVDAGTISDSFLTSNCGTLECQTDEDGTWYNLIQNNDLVASIDGVKGSIRFRLTCWHQKMNINHYVIKINNNNEMVVSGWPKSGKSYDYNAVVTTDLVSISSNITFIIGCVAIA